MQNQRQVVIQKLSSSARREKYQPVKPESITEIFGEKVFNETVMRDRLPRDIYKQLKSVIRNNTPLDPSVAEIVASTMKNWAIEHGATHFTHWFHPLTGKTAEKHDAFLVPMSNGQALLQFTGKDLTQGEPDASSLPSGGIRGTFEARGYTAWDPTSPAFIKDSSQGATLCIPTAFCSFTGEALDKKTPLLRSQEVLSKYALRMLKLLGSETDGHVNISIGLEQEYFLIDQDFFYQRPDLIACGRTLVGSETYKGQSLDDHYFGAIKKRVLHFMQDAEQRLYKLGIPVKTRHNEVAPGQYEIAPVYENANLSIDHNMLLMAEMKEVAAKHKLKMLVHEKPFAGLNGSGKHCNWSMTDPDGNNIFEPGGDVQNNIKFLTFVAAVIRGLDIYADLIRCSVAFAGNDHRLGANEAPPAILSVFLGEEVENAIKNIIAGENVNGVIESSIIDSGTTSIVSFAKDTTDRNRTSPFALTGNKFEFRALGASQHVAGPVYILNTVMAESLDYLSTEIEKETVKGVDTQQAVLTTLKKTLKAHQRIIFNGDNYAEAWEEEAERRGLPNLKSTADALDALISPKAFELFEKYNVLSEGEITSRYNIKVETYIANLDIEFKAIMDIVDTLILPAAFKYQGNLAKSLKRTTALLDNEMPGQTAMLQKVAGIIENLISAKNRLTLVLDDAPTDDLKAQTLYYKGTAIPAMAKVRKYADELEKIVDDNIWPLPKYREMLYLL
jgi:glutamine synthetase